MDTPETKRLEVLSGSWSTPFIPRFRESLKVSNSPNFEEPELHPDASPTLVDAKLKLKPRRRLEQLPEEKVQILNSKICAVVGVSTSIRYIIIPGQGGGVCPGAGDEVMQGNRGGGEARKIKRGGGDEEVEDGRRN